MIINRYLQRSIYAGTLLALLVLVSLNLFFVFVRELEDLQGSYGFLQVVEHLALLAPARIVEFLPLAVLLGCILSLGALAGNSEIIAMQASGISLPRLLGSVLQAALAFALISFALSEWVVPDSSTSARALKNQAQEEAAALRSREGLWIKDESRVVHISELLPNGFALGIEIFELDPAGKLTSTMRAVSAVPAENGWELQQVETSTITPHRADSRRYDSLRYQGSVSHELLQVLTIKPSRMSRANLYAYLEFLDENRLDAKAERLIFWQKLFAPFTIFVMCLLAFPFVLGAQRQTGTGYRLLIGILLGLSFVVVDRLLTQLGAQFEFNAVLIALVPNVLFLGLALYLLARKLSHGVGFGVLGGGRQR